MEAGWQMTRDIRGGVAATTANPTGFEVPEVRRAGRPQVLASIDRRRRLLDAAAAVFMEKGYAAATVDAIAAKAGMSKKTVYRVFESKLTLFDSLLDDRFFNFPEPADEDGGSLEESLIRILTAIANILLQPDRVALLRVIIAEGQAAPELATAFDRLKLSREMNALERWFERHQRRGALRVGNVHEAARLVFGLAIAEPMIQLLIAAPRQADDIPLSTRIKNGVSVFLYGLVALTP